jgi:hypothetical protein
MDHNFSWATNASSKNFLVFAASDQKVPLFDVAWTSTCPPKLLFGVYEPKVSNLILNVVVHQIFTDLFDHFIVVNIKNIPLKPFRKRHWIRRNFLFLELLDLTLLNELVVLHDWLTIPESMLSHSADEFLKSVPGEKMNTRVICDLLEPFKHSLFTEIWTLWIKL